MKNTLNKAKKMKTVSKNNIRVVEVVWCTMLWRGTMFM